MKKRQPKPKPLSEEELERCYEQLGFYEPYSKKYAAIMAQIEHHKKLNGKHKPERKPVDASVWISSATSLLGVVIIVAYEHTHVITSKALGLLRKP